MGGSPDQEVGVRGEGSHLRELTSGKLREQQIGGSSERSEQETTHAWFPFGYISGPVTESTRWFWRTDLILDWIQVVRYADHDDFGPAQQRGLDPQGRLVMQQVFPPMAGHELRDSSLVTGFLV